MTTHTHSPLFHPQFSVSAHFTTPVTPSPHLSLSSSFVWRPLSLPIHYPVIDPFVPIHSLSPLVIISPISLSLPSFLPTSAFVSPSLMYSLYCNLSLLPLVIHTSFSFIPLSHFP